MGPSESFVRLFRNITMPTVCLWITGVLLFCIEYFQPMHRTAYLLGGALITAAFCTRMIHGDPGVAYMFVMVTVLILLVLHGVSLFTQKRLWLRAARMEKAGERSRRYGTLVGSMGTAMTPIDLTGNVTVGDVTLVVYSATPIKPGETVRISEITPDKIIVVRAD